MKNAPESSVGGSWWRDEDEKSNILASADEGEDCKVERLVMKITPPTFKRIMLVDICCLSENHIYRDKMKIN